jgi:hypothetical protein
VVVLSPIEEEEEDGVSHSKIEILISLSLLTSKFKERRLLIYGWLEEMVSICLPT